jgi:hypothetical protein
VKFNVSKATLLLLALYTGCKSQGLPTPPKPSQLQAQPTQVAIGPQPSPTAFPTGTVPPVVPPSGTPPTTVITGGANIGTIDEQRVVGQCNQSGFIYRRTSTSGDRYAQLAGINENPGCSAIERVAPFSCNENALLTNNEIKADLRTRPASDPNGLSYVFNNLRSQGYVIDQCSLFNYRQEGVQFKFRIYFVKEEKNGGTTTITVNSIRIPQ